jgi:hypothetical protein
LEKKLEINMGSNKFSESLDQLFYQLSWDKLVVRLDLSYNNICTSSIYKLKTFLLENNNMLQLDLSYCTLKEEGGRIAAMGMEKCHKLLYVNLAGNDFGDHVGSLILKGLERNKSVMDINMSSNHLQSESGDALVKLLQNNQRIQNYSLNGNNFGDRVGERIINVIYKKCHLMLMELNLNPMRTRLLENIQKIVETHRKEVNAAKLPEMRDEVDKRAKQLEKDKEYLERYEETEAKRGDLINEVATLNRQAQDIKLKQYHRTMTPPNQDLRKLKKKEHDLDAAIIQCEKEMADEEENFKTKRIETMNLYYETDRGNLKLYVQTDQLKQETGKMKDTYLSEIADLQLELARLKRKNGEQVRENTKVMTEMQEEKKKQFIDHHAAPKISQVFLASSQLATFYKHQKDVVGVVKADTSMMDHTQISHVTHRSISPSADHQRRTILEDQMEIVRKQNEEHFKKEFEKHEKENHKPKPKRLAKGHPNRKSKSSSKSSSSSIAQTKKKVPTPVQDLSPW